MTRFFILHNSENLFSINLNLLETNIFNIFVLIALLIYLYNTSFQVSLKLKQSEISQSLANYQNDLSKSLLYYSLSERLNFQQFFCLARLKNNSTKNYIPIVKKKYKNAKNFLQNSFFYANKQLNGFEKQSLKSLKEYILLATGSKILEKYNSLSKLQQYQITSIALNNLIARRKCLNE
jgi:hypothetical protein